MTLIEQAINQKNALVMDILPWNKIEGIICKDICIDSPESMIDIMEIINSMVKTCNYHDGLGLAAPQVGINRNLFVILDPQTRTFTTYINPTWNPVRTSSSSLTTKNTDNKTKKIKDIEGCLSIKSKQPFSISRFESILASWHELTINHHYQEEKTKKIPSIHYKHEILLTGFRARAFQHEHEHLIGGNIIKTSLRQAKEQRKK